MEHNRATNGPVVPVIRAGYEILNTSNFHEPSIRT